jgi:hypothetical protein
MGPRVHRLQVSPWPSMQSQWVRKLASTSVRELQELEESCVRKIQVERPKA